MFLSDLAAELKSENASLRFSSETIDRALHARLSLPSNSDPTSTPLFDYLVSTWKRCNEASKKIQAVIQKSASASLSKEDTDKLNKLAASRGEVISTAKNLAVSYSGLVVSPDMAESFPQRHDVLAVGAGWIASKLLLDPFATEEELPKLFFDDFVARFDGDGLDEVCSLYTRV
jgi:hypothetical protein